MKVVTVINDENNQIFNLFRLSCALNGLELVVLVSNQFDFSSRRIKDALLRDYLMDEKDDEIILFSDGTDAVFTGSEEEILSKFYKYNTGLLFSAEIGCWPDKSLASLFKDNGVSPFKYLNSGGFIGKVGLIKEMLNDNDYINFPNSNQYVWIKRYLKHPDKIELDRNCEIFSVLFTEVGEEYLNTNNRDSLKAYNLKEEWFNENFLIEGHRFFNRITKSWSCHAHFNGTSRFLLNEKIFNMVYSAIPTYKKAKVYFEK